MKKEIRYFLTQLKYIGAGTSLKFRPVFLIGCGRSGTTVLGRTIGKHREVTYLNERRDLWHKAYPEFDIWSARVKDAKLIAKRADNIEKSTGLLRKLFHREQIANGGEIMLEKLPINNFRLEFIDEAFPEARYIYLHRNGLEVASSIEKLSLNGRWFGKNDVKWKLIEQLISSDPEIPRKDFTFYEKGLLEWRYSLDFSESFFSKFPETRVYSLSYKSFLKDPATQIGNIFDFLNLEYKENTLSQLTDDIERRSKEIRTPSDEYLELGGKYLPLSIHDQLRQSVPTKKVTTM